MKLSLLVCALTNRDWGKIVDKLKLQAANYSTVEVLVDLDSGEATSGVKRQRLTDQSKGEYIAFVDDDDDVSDDYVEAILEGTHSNADIVTFKLQLTNSVSPTKVETWKFGLTGDLRQHGLMSANHLCAWRKELATKVAWCPELGHGDDQLWYKPLQAAGLMKTEFFINKVLYLYQFDVCVTQNQSQPKVRAAKQIVGTGLKCYRLGNELFIQDNLSSRKVRDCSNNILTLPQDAQFYYTVKIS